jgi:2-polyprenyl-6-hydroxyphenyl methylase/3-demethylubiquinone-9 3-methyltransferase
MNVNNAMYDRLGHLWWDDCAGFEFTSLRFCVNPVRYAYFARVLQSLAAPGRAVLDIGCGGGYLAESFARGGYQVAAVDPAAESVAAARAHAADSGLAIDYRVGCGERLPFPDRSFDIVTCCDVLEHVDDVALVVREAARALKPGGVFLYDTVNRTLRSWLLLIKIWQDWGLAGSSEENAHVWRAFIKPCELDAHMRHAGLSPQERKGMGPGRPMPEMLRGLWRIRRGRLQGEDVAREFVLRESEDVSVSYMGWALRPAA